MNDRKNPVVMFLDYENLHKFKNPTATIVKIYDMPEGNIHEMFGELEKKLWLN